MVAAIVPWNYPLLLLAWKLAPGPGGRQHRGRQAVASYTPLTTLRLAEALRPTCPAGVVNVVTGDGPRSARRWSSTPASGLIAFTGSVATGQRIAAPRAPSR